MLNKSCRKLAHFILLLSGMLPCSVLLAADEPIPEEGSFGLGWLDETHAIATSSANTLANQVDRFFGEPRSDLEAAYSSLRLTLEHSWHEQRNDDINLRLRGKLYLPRINERLSLLFSEDEGEGEDYYEQNNLDSSNQESVRANLQFNLFNAISNRLDFRLGLRSSLKAKASIRYRQDFNGGDNIQHRLTETLFFVDGEGAGSITRYELDNSLSETSLLRWTTDLRAEENVSGANWFSQLSYSRRISDQTALVYYTRISGQTSPDYVNNYGVGFRIRRNLGRSWLFGEVEPGHDWLKLGEHEDRESSFYLYLRLEMAIGRI